MWGFLAVLIIMFLLRKRIKRFVLKTIIFILIGAIAIMVIKNTLVLLIIALVFFIILYIMSMDKPKRNNTQKIESGEEEK